MRRLAFPFAAIGTLALAALLVWLWATDYVPAAKCRNAGGTWNADTRICELSPGPPVRVSRPG